LIVVISVNINKVVPIYVNSARDELLYIEEHSKINHCSHYVEADREPTLIILRYIP